MVRQLVQDQRTYLRVHWQKTNSRAIAEGEVDADGWRDQLVEVSVRDLEEKVWYLPLVLKETSCAELRFCVFVGASREYNQPEEFFWKQRIQEVVPSGQPEEGDQHAHRGSRRSGSRLRNRRCGLSSTKREKHSSNFIFYLRSSQMKISCRKS